MITEMIQKKAIPYLFKVLLAGLCFLGATSTLGQAQGEQQFGDYTVYHTAFNSMFLQPDIAAAYGLARGEDLFLINISVNEDGKMHGREAKLTGSAKNLIQQQKKLKFKEINEGEATYYMAPLRVRGEEVLHFAIDIETEGAPPFTLKFTQKLTSE